MNKKVVGFGGAILVGLIIIGIVSTQDNFNDIHEQSKDISSDYEILNKKLKDELSLQGVLMSTPVTLSGKNIENYCKFFNDENIQKQIQYCTSTELREVDGTFLGNIHIVGTFESPTTIMTLIQSNPFVSQTHEIKSTFSSVIENVVCDCWEKGPEEFPTINSWIDGIFEFHSSGEKPTSKSQVVTIDGKDLQIELTTNTEGYLWKLLIDL